MTTKIECGGETTYDCGAGSEVHPGAEALAALTSEPTLAYYTSEGSVRGGCGHRHKTYAAAEKCIARDHSGCASQGGYSDRHVVAVDSDGSHRGCRARVGPA